MTTPAAPGSARPLPQAGFLLGFALGGFFDGILLHQVLQWHHLLSNVQAAALRDVRLQLLADGLFHAAMYLVAAWALYLLWRARARYAAPGADRVLWSLALVGFGTWHIVDAVLSHWVTGIHRIRMDSASPLFWDLLWFAVFGVVPLVAGLWLRARPGAGGGRGRTAAAAPAVTTALAAPLAALPSGEEGQQLVLFRPGLQPSAAFDALHALDARVLWVDRSGGLFAVKLPAGARASSLYERGAWLVSGAGFAAGCFGWTRAAP